MTPRRFLRQLARESRGARGRLAFFTLCLAVGVAGVVAVAGFSAALREALRTEARRLLGGDLRVEGLRELPAPALETITREPGVRVARVWELPTMAAVPPAASASAASEAGADGPGGEPGPSRLVELRAVEGEYPFYGRLALEPDRPLAELLAGDGAVAAPELAAALGLAPGDAIAVGGRRFVLRGLVRSEPDRIGGFALGPRLYLSGESLRSTGLVALGSRIEHRTLVALAEGSGGAAAAEALAGRVRAALDEPQFHRVQTAAQGQPELRRGVDRTERFLGLAALLSLLVGGVGVAQTARAWLATRLDAIAVWKTLGARPREIAALHLAQVLLLALGGSLAGALLGLAVQRLLPPLVAGLLPDLPLPGFQPLALARGVALGVAVALLFAIAPLAAALRVPAARVLRRDAEPLPPRRGLRWALGGALLAGTAAIAALQADSALYGLAFAGGLAATAALLALAARGLIALARRVPRLRLPLAGRWGVAALGRPGSGTLEQVVALGLGALVLVAMATVERDLVRRLDAELPTDAPTAFLIDIQPSQWDAVRAEIERAGATRVDSVPVVMARLGAIDGVPVRELVERRERAAGRAAEGAGGRPAGPDGRERQRDDDGPSRWALTREQRLTWLERLPDDNQVVAGALWSDPARLEVSVEEEFADDLGLGLGSVVTFDVQGVPVELTVTSLRRVRWETFGINFFLVAEPGALERAPQMRIAAVRLPPGREERLRDALAAAHPNVTLFAIRDVLEKVMAVLERIGLGIRFLGGFTVVAGAAILAGAVAAGAAQRGREVAIAKTLGLTRAQVAGLFAAEYGLAGLAAGLVGALAGTALAAVVLERLFEVPWTADARLPLAAAAAVAALAIVSGLVASLRPLARRPIEALRHD
jgi:putative ABC transport system permease protein